MTAVIMTAVIVSADGWERKSMRTGNLAEFFAASPLRGSAFAIIEWLAAVHEDRVFLSVVTSG